MRIKNRPEGNFKDFQNLDLKRKEPSRKFQRFIVSLISQSHALYYYVPKAL